MPLLSVGQENKHDIQLHYEDFGSGPAVVLIHGWPLSGRSWEKQIPPLLAAGYRVITYDRRGFGQSSQPSVGYNYDTLADDLNAVVSTLQLPSFTLVGFSMGGGEVARYVGKYGTGKLHQAVFISAVTPYLRKMSDNPEGVDAKVFLDIQEALLKDRPAFLKIFFKMFYNTHRVLPNAISDAALEMNWLAAVIASPIGTVECVSAWGDDFRKDLRNLDRPTLVVHGDADQTVPIDNSAKRMPACIKDCRLEIIADAPHGLNWTHAATLNEILLDFLKAPVPA